MEQASREGDESQPMDLQASDSRWPSDVERDDVSISRYKMTIAYDGSGFHGWQKQVIGGVDDTTVRTVGGVVESTLQRVLGQPITLVGASRTDAGVHARGQVAHCDVRDCRVPPERMALAINSRLPRDVEVISAEPVGPEFHAIRGVESKQYRYRIFHSEQRPLEKRAFVYHYWHKLDVSRMQDAAARLIGEHDVAGFAAASHGRATTVRTIHDCRIEQTGDRDREIHIVVEGNGFLYHMVRIISGTLIDVGRGRFEPDVIDRVLASGDRSQAGVTLPPNGLWLEWIRYGGASDVETDIN